MTSELFHGRGLIGGDQVKSFSVCMLSGADTGQVAIVLQDLLLVEWHLVVRLLSLSRDSLLVKSMMYISISNRVTVKFSV